MNSEKREMPRRQYHFNLLSETDIEVYTFAFSRLLKDTPVIPEAVQTTIDLYCGNGVMVAGELGYFPNATVHAVDVQDEILAPYLAGHERVQFHQGWIQDILLGTSLPVADFVSISYASRHYGLTEAHQEGLKRIVGGYLLTFGDNADLERNGWFRDAFALIKAIPQDFAGVWKVR